MASQTIRDLLNEGQRFLDHESSYLESQLLLGKALSKPRTWLIAHDEEPVNESDYAAYLSDIQKRGDGYPIAYLLGQQEFWNLSLRVSEDTLIPRPETECLVEEVIKRHPTTPCTLLDLGTGTGAIALALASEFPTDRVIATDKSRAAIEVAELNRSQHELNNVQFVTGSWSESIAANSIDIVVSNPPYIAEGDHHLAALNHEPESALVSGYDGLDDIKLISEDAKRYLKSGGLILIEHGFDQQHEVIKILINSDFGNIEGKQDLSGNPRFVVAVAP